MLKKLKVWFVRIIITAIVLIVVLWFPVKWTHEHYIKDAYYREVSGYVHDVEPLIAGTAFTEAVRLGFLTDLEKRGEFSARLDNLRDRSKDIVFIGISNVGSDTYGSLISQIVDEAQSICARRVNQRMGINRSFDAYDRTEWERQFKGALGDFNDIVEMDRLHNSLTWNYAGALWEKSFGTEYTMEKLAEDRAEYESERTRLDALLQKYGRLKK